MVEFTGERVVPDQVNADLWSEHLARYAFANRYARDKRVLDCGCGTGYGTAELAQVAGEVIGIDISEEAIEYARANYSRSNTKFVTGSCLDLTFAAESFDLVVAFEVIEHLNDYRRFVDECGRVLKHDGVFIVSTPNKNYYAESRADAGPNPFHEHEFDATEFQTELARACPHITLYLQNHTECFAFTTHTQTSADTRIDGDAARAEDAHFFIAACSKSPQPDPRSFIYVPTAANLLRERERHIRLLDDQLHQTQDWLAQTIGDRDGLLKQYRDQLTAYDNQKQELEARNRWAQTLSTDLDAARKRIDDLQAELAAEQEAGRRTAEAYNTKIRDLEQENEAKTKWAIETDERLAKETNRLAAELAECNRLLNAAEQTVVERTTWAQGLETKLNTAAKSRWVRLGRTLGLGPKLP